MAKRLHVGNLSYETTEDDLVKLFERFGEVVSVNIITDRDTGRSKGFAFVEMSDDDADKAIEGADRQELNGRDLSVVEARAREARGSRPRAGGAGRGR